MVGRPNATLSWTLRFMKTDDRYVFVLMGICDDNLKIDCERILFLFYL